MNGFDGLALVLVAAGAFFLLVGSIGVVRLPDFYTRIHAVGKSDTLGLVLVILGIAVHEGLSLTGVKLVAVVVPRRFPGTETRPGSSTWAHAASSSQKPRPR